MASGGGSGTRLRRLGRRECARTIDEMRRYTDARTADSADEVWLVEHPPVYTLGQAGRREHVRAPGRIPVLATDRGGQVTYHGPGQLVAYVLLDLRRLGFGVGALVRRLEQAVIDMVAEAGIAAVRRAGAPGVYVDGAKLAAVGLRVRRGCTYHGIALNVDGDLAPFRGIDPCGYAGLEVTRLRDLGLDWTVEEAGERLAPFLLRAAAPVRAPGPSASPAPAASASASPAPGRRPPAAPAA